MTGVVNGGDSTDDSLCDCRFIVEGDLREDFWGVSVGDDVCFFCGLIVFFDFVFFSEEEVDHKVVVQPEYDKDCTADGVNYEWYVV